MNNEEQAQQELRRFTQEFINERKEKALSQTELANITGIRQAVISRFESNKSSPNISTILKLLMAMNRTIEIVEIK